jgi:hypothetical protein
VLECGLAAAVEWPVIDIPAFVRIAWVLVVLAVVFVAVESARVQLLLHHAESNLSISFF